MVSKKGNEKSNRPDDTPFKQQRLRAWQPILTPKWVIGTFFVVGLIFIPVGVVLKLESDGVFEQVIQYDGNGAVAIEACKVSDPNDGYNALADGSDYGCVLKFTLDRDVDEDLYVYYQLDNFYQNHRRYVKSRSDDQLRNLPATASELETACDPAASFRSPTNDTETSGRIYYPCGLIAQSYFNDAFMIRSYNDKLYNHGVPREAGSPLLNETNIAWDSDLQKKFKNPTEDRAENYEVYEYIWQTYDQMRCYTGVNQTTVAPCQQWADVVPGLSPSAAGDGCAKCSNPDDVAVFQGGIPAPAGDGEEAPQGVRNEHFVVWMRTAGLPVFRKLYGKVSMPPGGFKEGDVLEMNVVSNFEVQSFNGKKSLVLGTVSPLGGKNSVLGVAYIAVGGICLFLALVFVIKEVLHPRSLGDPQYLNWK